MRGGLTQRVLLASVAIGAVVLGCFAVLVVALVSLHNEERNADQAGDVLAASNLLERSVLDLETGLRGYLLSGRTRVPPAIPHRRERRTQLRSVSSTS